MARNLPRKSLESALTGEQDARAFRGHPAVTGGIEPAAGDDQVQVNGLGEVLAPRMKNRGHAQLGSEVLGVAGKLPQGGDHTGEQQSVQPLRIGADEGIEVVGQREDDVEVRDRKEQGLLGITPLRLRHGLALWTVTVATGAEQDATLTAALTLLAVSAESGSAAAGDVAQDGALSGRRMMDLTECSTVFANDLGERDFLGL